MKAKIHPEYVDCVISCTCGNKIETRSTRKELDIAICGKCHPFYTGQQKFVDTAGRIEKFQKRFQITEGQGTAAVVRKTKAKSKKQIMAEARAKETEAKRKAASLRKESKTAERKTKKAKAAQEKPAKAKVAAEKPAKAAAAAPAKPEAKVEKPVAEEPKNDAAAEKK